jgi:NADH-quinone oxidoreductase subunit F
MTPDAVIEEVKVCFARARRRRFSHRHEVGFVPKNSPKPKYVVCNADESEPGTFKDRYLMERDPHL